MLVPAPRTPWANCGPRAARVVLVVTVLTILLGVAVSQSEMRNKHLENVRDGGGADIRLYQSEIARMQQGEGYYQVAGEELRSRGFPTRSIFNWRPPLLLATLAAMPNIWFGRLGLAGLAVIVLGLAFRILEREAGSRAALGGALLLVGALLPCFLGEGYLLAEVWAATLIALSLCAYGIERPKLGVLAGIAALFVRELAGLYCVLGWALAVRRRAWREAAAWTLGLTLYGLYFAWHAQRVLGLIQASDLAHRDGWVQLPGAPFVIAACQMNCLLLMLPQWVTAIYLPLAVLGLLAWRSDFGERTGLVTAAYLTAFAVVGQPFNQYWGVLIAPLLAFGFARAPAAVRDLWQAARWSERLPAATSA